MLAAVKKGDRVATSGGIRGTVVSVRDDSVVLKVDSQTKLEFSKSAVSQILDGVETKTTPKKKVEEEVAEEIEEDETDEVATDDEES
jgi:preprotein translocase subunit YajC